MDVLSDILAATRRGAAAVNHSRLIAPWGLELDPLAGLAIHAVLQGESYLSLHNNAELIQLREGDLVLIGAGVGHAIVDHPRTPPVPYQQGLQAMQLKVRGAEADSLIHSTHVLCAKYLFHGGEAHPLLKQVPRFVHLQQSSTRQHNELDLTLQLLQGEAMRADDSSELVVPRLVDSLLVFVLRVWLQDVGQGREGWFGALRDPAIAQALALIHEQPTTQWTVDSLARKVALSRATLARRFAELVGEPPVAYLTRWRLCLAAQLLTQTRLSLEELAPRVGYETAAALSKAFRRTYGVAPGRYRKESPHAEAGARGAY